MLKSLVAALVLASIAVTGFAVVAQAHHKVGHCGGGIPYPGCPLTPQGPQLPNPSGK